MEFSEKGAAVSRETPPSPIAKSMAGCRMPSTAGQRSRNRIFEWFAALTMLSEGLLVALSPQSIAGSHFNPILDVFTPAAIATPLLLVGWMRITALWFNGRWPVSGPVIRAGGAVVGAILWASMDVALMKQVLEVGRPPSPGIPVYTWLTIAEIYSAYRAASDVRTRL